MAYPYYEYELGLSVGTRTNVESLISSPPSPESELPHYPVYRVEGTGDEEADGFLQASWHFDYLSQEDFNTMEGYITGQSSVVHIKTKLRDGTYVCFQCFMHRPKLYQEAKRIMGGWRDVVFRFTHMALEACS
jgi:hypothetical protein